MSVPAASGGAAALRAARHAAGLTQEQLAERAGVSVRTVRGLESGRIATPHRHSRAALADALGLDGPAADRFQDAWDAHRSTMTFTRLVDAGHDVEALLAAEAERAGSDYLDISVTEKLVVGPDRRGVRNENLVATQALRDGVDRRLVLWGRDPQQDLARVRVTSPQNCAVSAPIPLPALDLVAFELSFGRVLAIGETHVFGYTFDLAEAFDDAERLRARGIEPTPTADAVHGFRRAITTYVLQVQFDGCRPPERVWQVVGPEARRRRVRALEVDSFGSVHITCQNLQPGVHGIAWEWD